IELDDYRDAHIGPQLAVVAVHRLLQAQSNPLDLAYLDALELDRCADPEAVDTAAAEVDDKLVGRAEQVSRSENHNRRRDQAQPAQNERTHRRRIDSLTHDSSLIFPRLLLRG